jgi:hypothetical protein
MSIGSAVRSSFAVFGVLSFSAVAFARQPPALVNAEEQAAGAVCSGAPVIAGAGYRDLSLRFSRHDLAAPRRVTARTPTGYRDAITRFGTQDMMQTVACEQPTQTPRLSASR